MRPLLLALLLSGSALAQPVDTARGEPHTVEVSAGDALLIRVANHRYGPASSAVPVAIVQPDGAVLDEQEYEPGVSFYITTGTSRVVPDAQPGTWTTTFLGEDERVEALSVELVAAPTLPLSLHEAALFDDLAALEAALTADEGAVHRQDASYRTALHVAAAAGHLAAARMLLDAGADPNAMAGTDGGGYQMTMTLYRPLHEAADAGHADLVALLLDAGADPNATDAQGMTSPPLVSAVYGGRLDVVRLLLDRGADPTAPTAEGQTPADLAANLAEADWTDDEARPVLREIATLLSAR